ncbi:MAG: hypothetical protein IJ794_03125 [Lachnospiraceae bacterium]|nr:hypothetical protein [Lachnospiraceae bacterium]
MRKKWTVLTAMITVVGMVFSGCVGKENTAPDVTFVNEGQAYVETVTEQSLASTAEWDKEENVQVEADASGLVKKITVETRLRNGSKRESGNGSGAVIEDFSTLQDIRNTEGDEEFEKSADGKLLWENHGEDIYYEGTSQAQLPVTLKISYELDGKAITPKELAGKSGRLRMRFDYVNRAKETVEIGDKEVEVCVPFTVLSMVVLPEEIFSDVKVENGKQLSMGDDKIAVGYAFPGLAESLKLSEMEDFDEIEIPDHVEITAQVTDFELDFTATVITPGLLEDFDTDDLEDIEEMIDDMDELRDASKELVDATGELSDGVDEFGDYLEEYVDAMDELRDGTLKFWESTRLLHGYAGQLEDGAKTLQGGLEALQKGITNAGAGNDAGSATVSGGDSLGELGALLADMNARLANLESRVDSEDVQAQQEIAALKQEVAVLSQYMEKIAGTMSQAKTSQEELGKAVGQLAEGSAQMTKGIEAFRDVLKEFGEGASALDDGVVEIRDAGRELRDGYDELVDGVGEFRDGVKKFDEEGIQELADLAGEDLQNLVDRVRALKEADGQYINFGGILPGRTGSVRFIIETEEIKP